LNALAEYGDKPFPFYSAFAEGKVFFAEKNYRQANSSFESALRYLDEVDFALFRIEILVWQAICLEELGYTGDATQALNSAIKLARTGEVIHPFVMAREGLKKLIKYLRRDESAWVLGHINQNGMQDQAAAQSESEDSDLTRREKEILNLIERGMSNREMAEKLVIAEGTLKRHVANLYQKLGVHNRAQAIKQFYRQ